MVTCSPPRMSRAAARFFVFGNMSNSMIARSSIDKKIAGIIDPVILDMGYEVVRVRMTGGETKTLQIMADRPEGGIDIDELADLSNAISLSLDLEDPFLDAYNLEVSSPGIDRPLTRLKDFEVFEGYEARIEIDQLIEGQRRFRGILAGIDENEVLINLKEGTIGLKFNWLTEAKLILNDNLIKKMTSERKNSSVLNEDKFDEIETKSSEEEV